MYDDSVKFIFKWSFKYLQEISNFIIHVFCSELQLWKMLFCFIPCLIYDVWDCTWSLGLKFVEFLEAMNVQPVFLLHATLMIPRVVVRPSLEDVQEALIAAGKLITNVSKGIGQWTGGKVPQVLDTWLHAYGLTVV